MMPGPRTRGMHGVLCAATCICALNLNSVAAHAPDEAGRLFDKAAPAVVKLYGASLGRQHGYGTGTLVSADGKILTVLSILVSGKSTRVVLHDGRRYDATLLRQDDVRKLALLQIDAEKLPHLTPVSSDALPSGETVLALGNWFKIAEGDEPVSLTRGIFSLKTNLDARRLAQDFPYQGEVLIYDAITSNPGAAGGPLLDLRGRFVGLVGPVVEAENTFTRINYAIPGEVLAQFIGGAAPTSHRAEDDRSTATASGANRASAGKPFIGLSLSKLGYRHVAAFVEKVRPGSPAEQAGIQPDDLIVAIEGRRIGDRSDYEKSIDDLIPGQRVQFTLKRGSAVVTADVIVGKAP